MVQFALDLGITALLCCIPLSVLLVLPRNPDDTLGSLLISVPVLMVAMAACVVISWWYWALLPSRRDGRTFAMGWLRLRVVGVDGSAARSPQLAIRWLMLIVDGLFGGLVAVAAMLTSQRGQRIGDLFANTVVEHAPKSPAGAAGASAPGGALPTG
ncbi:MAG TPA: RDD family protein [Candidatus Nanopelagicales bacterium]